MPKVRTASLRILASRMPSSVYSEALVESADYIDELENENAILVAENKLWKEKWEAQTLMVAKLRQEKEEVWEDISQPDGFDFEDEYKTIY